MIQNNQNFIQEKQFEYKNKIVLNFLDYCKKFELDLRNSTDYLAKEYNNIYSNPKYSYVTHYSQSPYLTVWQKVAEFITKEDKVIDIGCGVGQFMELLFDRGIQEYIGYDFSEQAIKMATGLIQSKNISYKVIYQNIYDNQNFEIGDVYVICEVLEHLINDFDKVLFSHIPKGKKIVITVPNYLGGSHVRKFDTIAQVVNRYVEVDWLNVFKVGNDRFIIIAMGIKL